MNAARILIVEDDVEWRSDFVDNLQQVPARNIFGDAVDGFEIALAGSQQEADELLARADVPEYDLVLLDLRYPRAPGDELDEEVGANYSGMKWLPELRRMQPRAAIVILTSWAFENELRNVVTAIRDCRANEFVPKTENFENVIGRICVAVEDARRNAKLAAFEREYRELLRWHATPTFPEDVGALIEQTGTSFSLLANRIESGDPSAIDDAPETIRAELRALKQELRRLTDFLCHPREAARTIDIVQLVCHVLDMHEGLARRASTKILAPSGRHLIATFESDLKMALYEIFANALESLDNSRNSKDNRELRVEIEQHQHQMVVRIVDNGDGFTDRDIEEMFQFGYSGRDQVARVRRLGLYVAGRMMLSIGGEFQANNRPDGGAEIALTIPEWPSR